MANPNKQSPTNRRPSAHKKRVYRKPTDRHCKQVQLKLTVDEYVELAQHADDMKVSIVSVIRQGLRQLGLRINEPKQQWELKDIAWEDLEDEADDH